MAGSKRTRVKRLFRKTTKRDIKGIKEEAKKLYAIGKKMPPKTRLYSKLWAMHNYFHAKRRHVPIRTGSLREFYGHYLTRLRYELKNRRFRPVIVSVGGVAGVGKTTTVKQIKAITERLHADKAVRVVTLSLDSYFRPRAPVKVRDKKGNIRYESRIGVKQLETGEFVGGKKIDGEFDNPSASDLKKAINDLRRIREGKPVLLEMRDVKTGRITTAALNPRDIDVLIVEGLFALHAPLAAKADITIGLEGTVGQQFEARGKRDVQERKRDVEGVARKFIERAPYQSAFVLPTLANAELILNAKEARKPKPPRARQGKKPGFMLEEAGWSTAKPGSIYFEEMLKELGLATDKQRLTGWRDRTGTGRTPGLVPGRTQSERENWIKRKMKSPSDKDIKVLERTLLKDRDGGIRRRCAEALGKIRAVWTGRSLERAIFQDPSYEVRVSAMQALVNTEDPRSYIPVLVKVLKKGGREKIDALLLLDRAGFWQWSNGVPTSEWSHLYRHFKEIPTIPDIIKEAKTKGWQLPRGLENFKIEP